MILNFGLNLGFFEDYPIPAPVLHWEDERGDSLAFMSVSPVMSMSPVVGGGIVSMTRMSLGFVSRIDVGARPNAIEAMSHNRPRAICWIKEIAHLSAVSTHCRDTAIEIFNRFLAITLVEDARLLHDTLYLSLAAAASLILSSKVHEGKANLTIAHFPHFSTEDLVAFERMMFIKIECKISALSTPTAFIAKLLELWPDRAAHQVLAAKAELFIAEFYEASESMFYAPSSLAISALLLSFSVLRMDCSHWLACIPDACFPRADNLQLEPALLLSLDIDACLTHFQSTNSVRSHLSPINLPTSQASSCFAVHSVSPTCVADLDGGAGMYHPSSPSYHDDMRSDKGWRSIVPFQTAERGGAASRVRALSCASPPPSPRRRCRSNSRSRGSDGSGRYDAGSLDVGAIEADSEL